MSVRDERRAFVNQEVAIAYEEARRNGKKLSKKQINYIFKKAWRESKVKFK